MRAFRLRRALWLFFIASVLVFFASKLAAAPASSDGNGQAEADSILTAADDDGDDKKPSPGRPDIHETWFSHPVTQVLYFDDSEYILAVTRNGQVHLSEDGGLKFAQIDQLGEDQVIAVHLNPFSKKVAIALGQGKKHWITKDYGKHWKSFEIQGLPAYRDEFPVPIISWHAKDEDKIILNTRVPSDRGQIAQALYTLNGFDTEPKQLRTNARRCLWANEQEHFTSGDSNIDSKRTLCIAFGKYSSYTKDQRLLMSNDYFENDEREPNLEGNRPAAGIVSIVTAKAFILAARRTEGTKEMALYVTVNTKKWHRAQFGDHQLVEDGYTIMESTNYSLQVDVAASVSRSVRMGTLYTSNSVGRSFVRNEVYTNRNGAGWVDFEKIAGIQGVALVNIVSNAEQVIKTGVNKKVKSQITFDDGRTFEDLKVPNSDDPLHLHSVTERNNVGRAFSNLAPGIVMGNGNTGSELKEELHSDLWVSDDTGVTFRKALSGSHMYEIGDQGSIILAIGDRQATSMLSYSFDHGENWRNISLANYDLKAEKVQALSLSNLPDSTSLKFLLTASHGFGSELDYYIYTLDFGAIKKRRCKPADFEEFFARGRDKNKKSYCIMGHTQKFRRRKADADCFIGEKFKDPKPEQVVCECSEKDFECKPGFIRSKDRKSCDRLADNPAPENKCSNDQKTFKDEAGFRKIPGNTCEGKSGYTPPKEVERPCPKGGNNPPSSGEVTSKIAEFDADRIVELFYLERGGSSSGDDETIILLTNEHEVYVSHDHGKSYERKDVHDKIVAIYPHRYFGEQVYLITPTQKVYYSKNRGKSFDEFDAPAPPHPRLPILRFHSTEDDWLIWTACQDKKFGETCKAHSYVSTKNGEEWTPMLKAVGDCEFVYKEKRESSKKLTYCEQHHKEDPEAPKRLLSSENWFEDKKELFEDMIHFATMSEYIVVAAKTGKNNKWLQVDASIDGETFADAKLPANLKVEHSREYTVLDSSTHSIFLHVTINGARGQEYGTIVKSNSNGTSYTMCLQNVNRNEYGYVDFEKMQALQGTAVANVVTNIKDMLEGKGKQLKTMITHDDGATWGLIKPPARDVNGRKFGCENNKPEKCSLHLHGYTERPDPRDTYSSPSAVGLMLAVGNVGEFVKPRREGNTFVTRDGGVTWKMAMEGQFMWEFGDHGGIIVIVEKGTTNKVFFSTDEGDSWKQYDFSDEKLEIVDITTVPSDTSRNFLLQGTDGRKAITVNLDFTGLTSKECNVTDPGSDKSDYELWEPKHPDHNKNKANCLFGHVSQYLRKKPDSNCYSPPNNFPESLVHIKKNCTCTRQDFECDYNFERQNDGSCKLVPGTRPLKADRVCKKKDVTEYWEPTGYRRLALSTCKGGKELDKSVPHACPGKEDEFNEKHPGIGGVGLFFAIVIPIGAAGAIGYWMWRNMDGRFGRIRLGDGGEPRASSAGPRTDWTKYPVMLVSGVVAVAMAVPMLLGVLWRTARERLPGGRKSFYSTYGRSGYGEYGNGGPYTSRDSFARGGRDYSDGPHNDERDLLGDDSDED